LAVIRLLSSAALKAKRIHGVILMVELGDLREGILPVDVDTIVPEILKLPNIQLRGIGSNLACRCGVSPDIRNMSELSALADAIEQRFAVKLEIVSGGNSGNLAWALSGADTGRINDLRLGESILLGCETLHRDPVEGLYTDAITLVAEVIESKRKPTKPWGTLLQNAFGEQHEVIDIGDISQTILAVGQQDIDPAGLQTPEGIEILGASSDHLIIDAGELLVPGSEIRFTPNYSSLVRAMTSQYVIKQFTDSSPL
ncbi:MAG: alanine racemase, partial [Gammaproteobacteria bacterium]|nr:alanine racemase [Gammaproteobacteria bacterium]